MTPEPSPAPSSVPSVSTRPAADPGAIAWVLLAIVGLGAFAAITIGMLNHAVWPFDRPILDAVRPWVGDGTIWRVLSESANIPLIVLGIAMVLILWARN